LRRTDRPARTCRRVLHADAAVGLHRQRRNPQPACGAGEDQPVGGGDGRTHLRRGPGYRRAPRGKGCADDSEQSADRGAGVVGTIRKAVCPRGEVAMRMEISQPAKCAACRGSLVLGLLLATTNDASARTIVLTDEDCKQMAAISADAPRMS